MFEKAIKKIQQKYKDLFESSEIFKVEQEYMEFFGYWPKFKTWNWRFLIGYFFYMSIDFFPKLNFLRGTFIKGDHIQSIMSISRILPAIMNLVAFLSFKLKADCLARFIDLLEAEWKRTDHVESRDIREKSFRHCIKIKKFVHFVLLILTIFYLIVPFLVFFFRFLITNSSTGEKFKPPTYVE
jgi:hypothetical protein